MEKDDKEKNITVNRKARHEYAILQTYEAGIVLVGTEVKALRQGKANLVDGYGKIERGEVWLVSVHISEYTQGNINNHDPVRDRKLLTEKQRNKKTYWKNEGKRINFDSVEIVF